MKKLHLLCAVLCFCLLCGCTPVQSPEPGSSEQPYINQTPCIAILLKSFENPYFHLIKAGAEAEADALGAQVMVVFPNEETNTKDQTDMLHTLATMSVDVIAIAPSDITALQEGFTLAQQNGKILMAIDTSLSYENCACSIGTDQYNAAYQQGEYAASLVNAGSNAIILRGQKQDKTHTLREYGLADALHNNGVQVLTTKSCNSSEKDAANAMQELLDTYPIIDVVCVTSDRMAIGVQRVIEKSGRNIHIVSFDGMTDVCELVRDGKMDATFAQDPYLMGQLCIRNAIKLMNKEQVPRTIYTDTKCITKSNAQSHITTLTKYLKREDMTPSR